MKVKAKNDLKVPMENMPGQYIGMQAVEVPNSLYYRRLVQDGDLEVVDDVRVRKERETKKGA